MEEENLLPELEPQTAINRAHLLVNAPTLLLFGLLFWGSSLLNLWPWAVGLVISSLLTAVYGLVMISVWENWVSRHNVTREEALYWRKKAWLDRQKQILGLLVGLSLLIWLITLLGS